MLSSKPLEIQAAVLRRPGQPVRVERVALAPPRADEVLVRVAAAGVCHSDVHLADGLLGENRWPIVLGHEGAGVVEAVGAEVDGVAPGDHVGFCFVAACGTCRPCRAGRPALCMTAGRHSLAGTLMDGSSRLRARDGTVLQHGFMVACFAEYVVLPAASAVPLPDSIPLWQAALLGCGVVTGLGAVRRAGVGVGDSVCVIGCGGVGLQVLAGARLAGAAPIVAVDRDADKLARARRRGATEAVDATATEPVRAVRALTHGGVRHAFEVVGRPETIRQAWDVLAAGGTATVVGAAPAGVEVAVPALELLREKTLTGSYYGSGDPRADLAQAAQLALDGRLALSDVVSDVIALGEVEAALQRLRDGHGARSVVVVDQSLAGYDE